MFNHRAASAALMATLMLVTSVATAFDPWAGDFSKEHPEDIRVMSYNVYNLFPAGTQEEYDAHARILRAIQPDIISYQEMDPGIAATLSVELGNILGGQWQTHEGRTDGVNVNIVASRWLLGARRQDTVPASSTRGTTIGLVNLPNETYPVNMYVMGVHFSCCSGDIRDQRRQLHADAIASWMGKARTPGGEITLPFGTPMIVVGDVNFNASANPQSRTTLMTGDIQDTATFGPPIKPDWDETDLAEALPLDPFTMRFQTFNAFTPSPNSWLDRFYYTDSVLEVSQGFILNTFNLPTDVLAALDLRSTDTSIASDHLPLVVDFALRGREDTLARPGDVFITEFQPDPTFVPDAEGEWFEVYNRASFPIDMNGWMLKDAGSNRHVIRREGGVVIAPGQHFVFGLNDNLIANGNVPVDYVIDSGFRLANGPDTIELYRGSVKIDGISYNGGSGALVPLNRDTGSAGPAAARAMGGDYSMGRTDIWNDADSRYNPLDSGTPGGWNDGAVIPPSDLWMLR